MFGQCTYVGWGYRELQYGTYHCVSLAVILLYFFNGFVLYGDISWSLNELQRM